VIDGDKGNITNLELFSRHI